MTEIFFIVSCNYKQNEKQIITNESSCYSPFKVIMRPDGTVADSIFINCDNENLFFHKKMYNGHLESTGYVLNGMLNGLYIMYNDDGKTILAKRIFKNGLVVDSIK